MISPPKTGEKWYVRLPGEATVVRRLFKEASFTTVLLVDDAGVESRYQQGDVKFVEPLTNVVFLNPREFSDANQEARIDAAQKEQPK